MFDAIDRLVHTGDPDAAVHQLRRLLVLHPALQPAYARLAELTGEADVFEHAAALAPGSAHAALQEFWPAIEEFTEALKVRASPLSIDLEYN